MKNKTLFISVFITVLLAIVLAGYLAINTEIGSAARPGKFDNGYFVYPDYNNGDTETFNVSESRTFDYVCLCGDVAGKSSCDGYVRLEVDTGSGFVNEKSDVCSINENQTCSVNYVKTFITLGAYKFRVFCDESLGTDYTQPSTDYVVLTVEDTCVEGETRSCSLQGGVCEGSYETCMAEGVWSGCDYGSIPNYGPEDTFGCDSLDNDCDGFVDDIDNDGDLSSPCGGMGAINELLIQGLNDDDGNIAIFAFNPTIGNGSYSSIWSTYTPDLIDSVPGGEIGDITHNGINDFVIVRKRDILWSLEVWSYNSASKDWYRVWKRDVGSGGPLESYFVGDIGDFDNDGFSELLVTNQYLGDIEIFGNDVANATSFNLEATVKDCDGAKFISAAGDLNNNGIPEIIFQCKMTTGIEIYEYNTGSGNYEFVAMLEEPLNKSGANSMFIDDMESGDVDRDGVDELVFCGNSGRSHVLDYSDGTYSIVYNTPENPSESSFTQTCSIGDITNDGYSDWFDCSPDGARVFSYQDGFYQHIWNSASFSGQCPLGGSFIGDSDNDSREEFVHGTSTDDDKIILWESNLANATSFDDTFTWSPVIHNGNIIIGNFNPDNDDTGIDCNDNDSSRYPGALEICGDGIDQDCDGSDTVCNCADNDSDNYYGYDVVFCSAGDDCNDNDDSINPGAEEVCDDGIDNNCNDQVDEGCVTVVCGDGDCAGNALGEDCFTCSDDCFCAGRDCSNACCGDGTCSSPQENSTKCPIDCSATLEKSTK